MLLPKELWKNISLFLFPKYLNLICKQFNELYDDFWYKTKLQLTYPNVNLWTPNTYEYLYKQSCKTGTIIEYLADSWTSNKYTENITFDITGVKIAQICDGVYMILKFNGDLWITGKITYLFDIEVVDITHNSYIKQYEWYYVSCDGYTSEIIQTHLFMKTDELLSVYSYYDNICAITTNILYYANGSMLSGTFQQKVDSLTITQKYIPNMKNMSSAGAICIIVDQKNTIRMSTCDNKILDVYNLDYCKSLIPGTCKLTSGKYLIPRYIRKNDKFIIYTSTYDHYLPLDITSGVLLSCHKNLFLYDGKIYKNEINDDSIFIERFKEKIIGLYNNHNTLYLICNT